MKELSRYTLSTMHRETNTLYTKNTIASIYVHPQIIHTVLLFRNTTLCTPYYLSSSPLTINYTHPRNTQLKSQKPP